MLRLILLAFLLLVAAPARATDWRLLYLKEAQSSATFVDLDSIVSRDGDVREVTTYVVERENGADGTAARTVDLHIECDKRLMMLVRHVRLDEVGRQIDEYRGTPSWWGPFDAGTQPAMMIDFVCSKGASHPDAESWGAENPFGRAREQLRAGPG